jgi:hypothetical protein
MTIFIGLGKIERVLLNIAFLLNILFMVKARLLESNHSLSFNVGNYTSIYSQTYSNWVFVRVYEMSCTNSGKIRSKNESLVPKKRIRIYMGNLGLPKGSNPYGNRGIIVLGRGRIPAINEINKRKYTTDCSKDKNNSQYIFDKLNSLHKRSIICSKEQIAVDRKLYNLMCDINLIKLAYENLKSKPGNLTPALNPETLDGISLEVLENIINKLKTESFQFNPSRRVNVAKPKGGYRSLSIAPPRDKLVQEMMRMILNAVFDPRFSHSSHGFRPYHSCHTALKMIQRT